MHRFRRRAGWIVLGALLFSTAPSRGVGTENNHDASLQSYYAANGFLQRGLFDLAAAEYRSFLAKNSEHEKASTARYGLAVCLFRTSKPADAAKELEALAKSPDFPFAVDVLTMLGQCRMASGEFDSAAIAFSRVLAEHGDHKLAAEASTLLAESLLKAGKADEASSRCKEIAKRWPKAPQNERADLIAGMAEMKRGNYADAAASLERLLRDYTKSANRLKAELLLAQCLHHLNRADEAATKYRAALEGSDASLRPDALYGLALLMLQKGDHSQAQRLLDELIEKFPKSPSIAAARLLRGRTAFEAKSFAAAIKYFEQAASSPESAAEAEYWIAKCELRENKFKEAASRLDAAMKAHPKSELIAEMRFDHAVALGRAGDLEPAIAGLGQFFDQFSTHSLAPDAMELLATLLHRVGKYEDSEARCDEFVKRFARHPRTATIEFVAAEDEFLRKRYTQAAARYRTLLEQFPKDENAEMARYRLGMSLQYAGKTDEAVPYLAEAVKRAELDQRVRPAIYVLANASFDRGEWKIAEDRFVQYLKKPADSESACDARLKLGLALARQNRNAEAVKAFDLVIASAKKGPSRLQAIFERGQVQLSQRHTAEAKASFEQVLAEGTESRFAPYARNHLSALALQSGDLTRANQLLAEGAKSAPTPELAAEFLFNQAQAQSSSKEYEAAARSFHKFCETYPKHALAMAARAQEAVALSRAKKTDDALKVFGQIAIEKLDEALRPTVLYEQGWCLNEAGKKAEAAAIYRQLIESNDKGPLRHHAMLELAVGEAANKHYDAALKLASQLLTEIAAAKDESSRTLLEQAMFRSGMWEFEAGQYEKAAETLTAFVEQFEKSTTLATANYHAGEAYFHAKKFERAAERLNLASSDKLPPELMPSLLLRCGEVEAQLQHWSKSEQAFEKYLHDYRARDSWYQAAFGIGWARENQGRVDEAVKSYQEVVEKHKGPTAARAQFQIGECLFAKKQYEAAVRELLKVDILYDYPEWSAAALYEAGRCFVELAKTVEARKQFTTVIEKYGKTQWSSLASQRLSELKVAAVPGHTSD